MLMAVFVIAMLSALVIGMLHINTEEVQLMQNHVDSVVSLAIAEAGLNDALAEIRSDDTWNSGFSSKSFDSGSYTVKVSGSLPQLTIASVGTSSKGFVSRVEADIWVGTSSPHAIRIDELRINE